MKLHLYVWSERFFGGQLIAEFYSWEQVAGFIKHWADPDYVLTVIDERE